MSRTSRWPSSSAAGSAPRSSTGWSSRCSAASTPDAPTRSRSTRRCRGCSAPSTHGARSWRARAASLRSAGRQATRPVFASVVGGLGPLPGSLVDACGLTVRTGAPVAVAAAPAAAGGWSVGVDDGRDPSTPTASSSPCPPFAAAPLLAPSRPTRPPSWPRARVRIGRPGHAGLRRRSDVDAPLAGHRLPGAAGRPDDSSRPRRSSPASGSGCATPRRAARCCASRSDVTATSAASTARRRAGRPPSWTRCGDAARAQRPVPGDRTSPAGSGRCRSTASDTAPGWTPRARLAAARAWPWPVRPRTASASRPASRRAERRPTGWPRPTPPGDNGGVSDAQTPRARIQHARPSRPHDHRQAGPRPQRRHPLHHVVGVPERPTPQGADRAAWPPRSTRCSTSSPAKDVVVRGIYDVPGLRADADFMVWWHAETSDELQDAYRRFRRTALGARLRAGLVADGAAPPGGVQQEPHPGVPGRRGARALRLRLPVRAVLRVVPAARRGAPRDARRARPDGARLPRRARQHGRVVRARRLRVAAGVRGRRAATASST